MTVETRVIIDANASNAIREISKLDKVAADTDDTLAELDGAKVNVDTRRAVDALEDVDTAAADAGDAVDRLSAERVTITADTSDVTRAAGDVDQLATKTREPMRIDIDVDTDRLDTVKKKVDQVESSGRAGSTAIGGIGNTISELPGVGALGPIAESLGQLSENALEGGESLKGIATAIGVLGGAAVVLAGINDIMSAMAKGQAARKAFNTDQIKQFNDALKEGGRVADNYADSLEETGEVLAVTGQKAGPAWAKILPGVSTVTGALGLMGKFGDEVENIVGLLNRAGVSGDIWAKTITAKEPIAAMADLRAALELTNLSAGERSDILVAAKAAQDNYNDSVANGTEVNKFFGIETDKTTGAQQRSIPALDDNTAALQRHRDALGEARNKTDQLREANEKLRDDIDKRQSYLDLMDTFDELEGDGEDAWYAVASGAKTAEEAARDSEQQMLTAKEKVQDYLDQVEDIPIEKQTEIQTLIDQKKYAEAERALDKIERDRNVLVNVKALIDPRLEDSRFGGVRTGRSAPATAGALTVNVTARPSMLDVDTAIKRWSRLQGAG